MPTPRTNDTWGMGWQNLYEVEVMEMKAADLTKVCFQKGPKMVIGGSSHAHSEQGRGSSHSILALAIASCGAMLRSPHEH